MRRHNVQKTKRSGTVLATSTLPWRFFILTVLCACIMAAGFFFAARQHFLTMDLGLKNSKMRKQVEDLESERRRLILAKEVSISPSEIMRAAQTMGFRERTEMPLPSVVSAVQEVKQQKEAETVKIVQTSLRQPDRAVTAHVESGDAKKVVKPIIQQTAVRQKVLVKTAAKQNDVNERPRVVSNTDKGKAQVSSKTNAKLR